MCHLICCKVLVCEMQYVFVISLVRNSPVNFPLYLTVILLYLYNLSSGILLVRVKGNGTSFATD